MKLREANRVCARCGEPFNLQFDVIDPTFGDGGRHHRALGGAVRMHFYLDQLENENLQLLCDSCNSSKAHLDRRQLAEIPATARPW